MISKQERIDFMNCLVCKNGEMSNSKHSYFAQINDCYVIIENVPCHICNQCGEVFFSASVLERIDEILETIENISSKIFIMNYSNVA